MLCHDYFWPVTNYSDYIIQITIVLFLYCTVSIALALALALVHSNSTIDNDVI